MLSYKRSTGVSRMLYTSVFKPTIRTICATDKNFAQLQLLHDKLISEDIKTLKQKRKANV